MVTSRMLNNPMRFSIRNTEHDIGEWDVQFTRMEIRPSEGQVYLHWEEE